MDDLINKIASFAMPQQGGGGLGKALPQGMTPNGMPGNGFQFNRFSSTINPGPGTNLFQASQHAQNNPNPAANLNPKPGLATPQGIQQAMQKVSQTSFEAQPDWLDRLMPYIITSTKQAESSSTGTATSSPGTSGGSSGGSGASSGMSSNSFGTMSAPQGTPANAPGSQNQQQAQANGQPGMGNMPGMQNGQQIGAFGVVQPGWQSLAPTSGPSVANQTGALKPGLGMKLASMLTAGPGGMQPTPGLTANAPVPQPGMASTPPGAIPPPPPNGGAPIDQQMGQPSVDPATGQPLPPGPPPDPNDPNAQAAAGAQQGAPGLQPPMDPMTGAPVSSPMQDPPPPTLPSNPRMFPPRPQQPSDGHNAGVTGGLGADMLAANNPVTQHDSHEDLKTGLMAMDSKTAAFCIPKTGFWKLAGFDAESTIVGYPEHDMKPRTVHDSQPSFMRDVPPRHSGPMDSQATRSFVAQRPGMPSTVSRAGSTTRLLPRPGGGMKGRLAFGALGLLGGTGIGAAATSLFGKKGSDASGYPFTLMDELAKEASAASTLGGIARKGVDGAKSLVGRLGGKYNVADEGSYHPTPPGFLSKATLGLSDSPLAVGARAREGMLDKLLARSNRHHGVRDNADNQIRASASPTPKPEPRILPPVPYGSPEYLDAIRKNADEWNKIYAIDSAKLQQARAEHPDLVRTMDRARASLKRLSGGDQKRSPIRSAEMYGKSPHVERLIDRAGDAAYNKQLGKQVGVGALATGGGAAAVHEAKQAGDLKTRLAGRGADAVKTLVGLTPGKYNPAAEEASELARTQLLSKLTRGLSDKPGFHVQDRLMGGAAGGAAGVAADDAAGGHSGVGGVARRIGAGAAGAVLGGKGLNEANNVGRRYLSNTSGLFGYHAPAKKFSMKGLWDHGIKDRRSAEQMAQAAERAPEAAGNARYELLRRYLGVHKPDAAKDLFTKNKDHSLSFNRGVVKPGTSTHHELIDSASQPLNARGPGNEHGFNFPYSQRQEANPFEHVFGSHDLRHIGTEMTPEGAKVTRRLGDVWNFRVDPHEVPGLKQDLGGMAKTNPLKWKQYLQEQSAAGGVDGTATRGQNLGGAAVRTLAERFGRQHTPVIREHFDTVYPSAYPAQSGTTKLSAQAPDGQYNTAKSPTGESKGLSLSFDSDHHAFGREAWDTIPKYLRSSAKKKHPDPSVGKHAGDYNFDAEDCPECGASMEGDSYTGTCNSCQHKWGTKKEAAAVTPESFVEALAVAAGNMEKAALSPGLIAKAFSSVASRLGSGAGLAGPRTAGLVGQAAGRGASNPAFAGGTQRLQQFRNKATDYLTARGATGAPATKPLTGGTQPQAHDALQSMWKTNAIPSAPVAGAANPGRAAGMGAAPKPPAPAAPQPMSESVRRAQAEQAQLAQQHMQRTQSALDAHVAARPNPNMMIATDQWTAQQAKLQAELAKHRGHYDEYSKFGTDAVFDRLFQKQAGLPSWLASKAEPAVNFGKGLFGMGTKVEPMAQKIPGGYKGWSEAANKFTAQTAQHTAERASPMFNAGNAINRYGGAPIRAAGRIPGARQTLGGAAAGAFGGEDMPGGHFNQQTGKYEGGGTGSTLGDAAVGAVAFNPWLNKMIGRGGAATALRMPMRGIQGGLLGSMGGSGIDYAARMAGQEGTHFGHTGATLGTGFGATSGLGRTINKWSAPGSNAANFGRKLTQIGEGGLAPMTRPFSAMGKTLGMAGKSNAIGNANTGRIAAMGLGGVMSAQDMIGTAKRDAAKDFRDYADAYVDARAPEWNERVRGGVEEAMDDYGMIDRHGRFNPVQPAIDGVKQQTGGHIDNVIRQLGMDPARMGSMQKMMLLGGGLAAGGGLVAGSPLLAAGGGLAAMGGLLPHLMPGQGQQQLQGQFGQGQPQQSNAPPWMRHIQSLTQGPGQRNEFQHQQQLQQPQG